MKPVYLKTNETRLAGAERRLRFLERRSQTPEPDIYGEDGGGIQFETKPQAGDWLWVETTGGPPTSDAAIELSADGGDIALHGDTGLDLNSSAGPVTITGASLTATANGMTFTVPGPPYSMQWYSPDFLFIGSNSGNADFVVNVDGDFLVNAARYQMSLPTSAPGASGYLWNDGGTVKIS